MPINEILRSLIKLALQDMFMTVSDLTKNMRRYCKEIFEDTLEDRLIDLSPRPPKKNFTVPKRATQHYGTIDRERLPELYNYALSCNSSAAFKACAVALNDRVCALATSLCYNRKTMIRNLVNSSFLQN